MKQTVKTFYDIIDQFAPFDTADSWDNSGLIIGSMNSIVSSVLVALDITLEVVEEAIQNNCQLIITHHPIIFTGVMSITEHNYVGKLLQNIIQNNIAVIAAHTNLDLSPTHGINLFLSKEYHLLDCVTLNNAHGYGIVGNLSSPTPIDSILQLTKSIFRIDTIKVSNYQVKDITKIAICSGASADFIEDALASSSDLYITSDIKYHEAQKILGSNLILFDVGHFESESIILETFRLHLMECLSDQEIEIRVSTTEKPMFKYL
ncbi:Nif3-like dinuclear metal center hexameric protein [Fusibacter bizertensis]